MHLISRFVCLAALLAAIWPAGRALAGEPQTYLVIVGAGTFEDKQIKSRPTADLDAQSIYDLFTDAKYLGVPPESVSLFLSVPDVKRGAKPAAREPILSAIKETLAKATAEDRVLIFFIGQGASVGDKACFLTADTVFAERAKTAITAPALEEAFKNSKSKHILIAYDLNFKGFDPGKESVLAPNLSDLIRVSLGLSEKGMEKDDANNESLGHGVILSARGGSIPVDLKGNGAFTTVLLEGLQGAADTDGGEPDGVITVDEILGYLESKVPPLARANGKSNEEKEQLPVVDFARWLHFPITHNPAVWPTASARMTKFAKLVEAGTVSPELAVEGKKLLERMPKLAALRNLRKEYAKLADGTIDLAAFTAARDSILEGMRLSMEDAKTYATRTLQGILTIQNNYIKELNGGEMTAAAIKGLYRRLDEQLPAEIENKLKNPKSLDEEAQIRLLIQARLNLGKREDLEKTKDTDFSLAAVTRTMLDPHSAYIDSEQVRKMQRDLTATFTGVGIQIRQDLARDAILCVSPIKGSPAYRAGIQPGDLIVEIRRTTDSNGKPLPKMETYSTSGMKVERAVELILGEQYTPITLVIKREGVDEPIIFNLKRDYIEVETVLGAKRKSDDSWDFYIDPESKIGYIRLTQFAENSAQDIEKAVKTLERQGGIKGLILDLRFNPGGYLDSAVRISDLFIDDGEIVSIRPRVGRQRSFTGRSEGSKLNFPMVCMINGMSASGSEIVASALQDHNRAKIIGERSYGKGSVQSIERFEPTGGRLKFTTATFWRPNGRNLNKASTKQTPEEDWGVRPDEGYNIELTVQERSDLLDHMMEMELIPKKTGSKETKPPFKDRQLDEALKYLREQIKTAARG